jgi:hypothetical protein
MVGMTKSADALAKQEASDKHSNYAKDHVPVFTKVAPGRETNDYIDKMAGLGFSADEPQTPTIFSAAYESRIGEFQLRARNVLESNNLAASDIRNSQNKISQLKAVSDGTSTSVFGIDIPLTGGAAGYVSLVQSGGQISTFLSQELSKLRVDIGRQILAETQFTLNEQQEREDELLAFGQALKLWTVSESAGGSY